MQVNNKNQQLPFSKKYPRLFVLKKSILVIVLFIGIIGIADTLMYVHIIRNPEPTANLSFVNDIIVSSRIEGLTGQKIGHLLGNMLAANSAFYFQKSCAIIQETDRLTPQGIKNVFRTHDKNILFIFSISANTTTSLFSVFVPSSFSLPTDQSDPPYNQTIQYFTFQEQSGHPLLILSMQKQGYLNMNQKWFLIDEEARPVDNVLCKTYLLAETKNVFFKILGILGFVDGSNNIYVDFPQEMFRCFGMLTDTDLQEKVSQVLNMEVVSGSAVEIKEVEVYYLHN